MMGIGRFAAYVAAIAVFVGINRGIAPAGNAGEASHVLTVESADDEAVPVAGDKPGITPYTAACSHMEVVSLTAPPTVLEGTVVCTFAFWMIDYIEQPAGQTTIHVTMDSDHTVIAGYELPDAKLTVSSMPITGVKIMHHVSWMEEHVDGVTNYTQTWCESKTLRAPWSVMEGDDEYEFVRWELDGVTVADRYLWISGLGSHNAIAVYEARVPALSVSSKPMGGVIISGDLPGTTGYTAAFTRRQAFTLTAPASVATEDGEHPFLHWSVNAATQPEGQTSVEILTENYLCNAVAVYFEFHPVLTVKSSPSGISIGGDKPGTAEYTAECAGGEAVRLQAPLEATIEEKDYVFSHWMCTTTTTKTVDTPEHELVMNESTRVVACYDRKPFTLTVRSEPFAGISIGGTSPGDTDYTVPVRPNDDVLLEAPSDAQHDAEAYRFLRWVLDGIDQPLFEAKLQTDMTGDITCVAVYATATRLTISSSPSKIPISGDKQGITPYTAACLTDDPVVLDAPPTFTRYSSLYDFAYWEINGIPQAAGQSSVTIIPVSDCSAEAVYELVPQIRVESYPRGIPIRGDKPGITDYLAPCRGVDSVYLEAPSMVESSGHRYRFMKWVVFGSGRPTGETGITISTIPDPEVPLIIADARYEPLTVAVQTSLGTSVDISGSRPGTTGYSIDYNHDEVITLEAPMSVVHDGILHRFARWVLDNDEQPALQNIMEFTPSGGHQLVAVYVVAMIRLVGPADRGEPTLPPGGGTFTVDVFLSCPVAVGGFTSVLQFFDASGADAAFPISSGPAGDPKFDGFEVAFNYARWPSVMCLFQREPKPGQSQLFGFASMGVDTPVADDTWVCSVTCQYGPSAEGSYAIRCHADRSITVVASTDAQELSRFDVSGTVVIGLAADLNGDCIVNDIDLMALRGLLGQQGSPGMRGDINRDGAVDVCDMIILRNRMGKTCGE